MYGTIMRAKVKSGRRAEYEKVLREMLKMPEDQIKKLYAEGILVRDPTLA